MTYPPEPWVLHGDACLSVWLADAARLPPPPVRPLTVRGRALVGTAFVAYQPPGLAYHELVVAVLVRRGWRLGVSVNQIWVDSPVALAGGRELWGIPKEHATFDSPASAHDDRGPIAHVATSSPRFGLRLPLTTSAWQVLGTALVRTPLRGSARVHPVRATWRANPAGPLSWLPTRPLLSVALNALRLRFGPRAVPGPRPTAGR
ncbi:acetoacetate decarboxylase family protein [Saccharothrix syringae]|uniref:Acetoacetate decarboxylase n=1 Tax=Saccharothrix syringae TaxID=103733 RepID=A0A5Q0GY21_SACSY|nr:acetoacetate decarboxylase family protein [Saccharothrix syringae]QFZ18252.1 acetoacetate decarboxylase [Saccharothrix syringae]